MTNEEFVGAILDLGRHHYREMPWRKPEKNGVFDPYKILLSECMLQQTQVARVVVKFNEFIQKYPTITDLANANEADILRLWSGLGYNRRALYLLNACRTLAGKTNWTYQELVSCKGIGPNTAKAILVYSFNQPQAYIETNIRTVYLYYYFKDLQEKVSDEQLLALVQETLYYSDPRTWYWALMDVGAHLKSTNGALLHKSKTHKKQSSFNGSLRKTRGLVVKSLVKGPHTFLQLQALVSDDRLAKALISMEQEGLLHKLGNNYYLGNAK